MLAALVDRAEWDGDLRAMKVLLVQEHLQPLVRVLAEGQVSGELRADTDLRVALSQLVGPVIFRRFLSDEALSETFMSAVVDLFLATAAAPKRRRR